MPTTMKQCPVTRPQCCGTDRFLPGREKGLPRVGQSVGGYGYIAPTAGSGVVTRASRAEQQTSARRIAAVEAENERLREELAEAEQKLEAITSIERSIREQE